MKFKCIECQKEVSLTVWQFLGLGYYRRSNEEEFLCMECCKKNKNWVSVETVFILIVLVFLIWWFCKL